jgi:hypothetical protein
VGREREERGRRVGRERREGGEGEPFLGFVTLYDWADCHFILESGR